jgi:hypothetical protein
VPERDHAVKGLAYRLAQFYTCLLGLYPPRYRSEFGEERQEVFTMVLQETAGLGKWALVRLALHELRDLLKSAMRANWREWEAFMKTLGSSLGEERLSWIGLLAGVWPFIFLGPIMAVAPYLPGKTSQLLTYEAPLWLATVFLSLLIGIIAGWRKGFPRWVYPYLVILFAVIVVPLMGRLSLLLGPDRFSPWVGAAILLGSFLGLVAAALFLVSRIPPVRKIFRDVRNDWTRVSFGMFAYLAFATGFYGGDHLPPFGPAVWLPAVVVVLGALAHLISRSRWARSLALIAALLISFLLKIIFSGGDTSFSGAALILVLFIFLPALVELLPHPKMPLEGQK